MRSEKSRANCTVASVPGAHPCLCHLNEMIGFVGARVAAYIRAGKVVFPDIKSCGCGVNEILNKARVVIAVGKGRQGAPAGCALRLVNARGAAARRTNPR